MQFECGTRMLRVISRAGSLCRVDKSHVPVPFPGLPVVGRERLRPNGSVGISRIPAFPKPLRIFRHSTWASNSVHSEQPLSLLFSFRLWTVHCPARKSKSSCDEFPEATISKSPERLNSCSMCVANVVVCIRLRSFAKAILGKIGI